MTAAMGYAMLTFALLAHRLFKADSARTIAFGAVLLGLLLMIGIQGNAGGIVAFAAWTLVSYAVLNFPVASMLYLFAALCYILKLQGAYPYGVQIVSNLSGVAGLVAIWYGKPRWQYNVDLRAWGWRVGVMASDASPSCQGDAKRQDAP